MLESRHCGPRCRSGEIGRRKGLAPNSSGFNPHDLDRYDNPRYSAPTQPQQQPPSYNYNDSERFASTEPRRR